MTDELQRLHGARVLVAGAGISGRATIEPLLDLGARVTVTDRNPDALAHSVELGADTIELDALLEDIADDNAVTMREFALVVTSPGFPPDAPLLSRAAGAAVPIWGDIELSWRIDQAEIYGPARRWLVVTGTNGKTTTTMMLHAILESAGISSVACGNIGLPVLDALRRDDRRATSSPSNCRRSNSTGRPPCGPRPASSSTLPKTTSTGTVASRTTSTPSSAH